MTCYRVDVTLESETTFGNRPAVSNEMRTLDYIPATSLRGAIYDAIRSGALAGTADDWLDFHTGPRWGPCWPVLFDGSLLVSMPRCFLRAKNQEGLGSPDGVWNALSSGEDPCKVQRVRMGKPWLKVDAAGNPESGQSVDTEIPMHVALDYQRQSNRIGPLYSREVIPSGQRFWGVVHSDEKLNETAIEVYLGKRRSLQGRASLRLTQPAEDWLADQCGTVQGGTLILQLLSDGVIPGARGGWLRGLDDDAATALIGKAATARGASAYRMVNGWSGSIGLPREQVLAIEAGSTWVIECGDQAALHPWAKKISEEGLGVRTKEGFGLVAVNPKWLTGTRERVFGQRDEPGEQMDGTSPLDWPGFRGNRDRLISMIAEAKAVKAKLDGFAGKVKELAAYSRRVGKVSEVEAFLEARASRTNARGWDTLKKEMPLPTTSLSELQFYLDALWTELGGRRE